MSAFAPFVGLKIRRGVVVLISECDVELVKNHTWGARKQFGVCRSASYATSVINGECVAMHRLILGLGRYDKRYVDHINGDGLDNRRENLRLATNSQNQGNRRASPSKLGIKGVTKRTLKNSSRFQANIRGQYLGTFESAAAAAAAYDRAAAREFGEFACTNSMLRKPERKLVPSKIIESGRPTCTELSPREREIQGLLESGLRLTKVAARLGISVKTASTHRVRAAKKRALQGIAS